MKKFSLYSIAFLAFISAPNYTRGAAAHQKENIRLRDQKTLTDRLHKLGFEHFVEKTTLVKDLANQEKHPCGVVMAVELALYDYNEYLNNPIMENLMHMRKPELVKALLQDHPEAMVSLKKCMKFE